MSRLSKKAKKNGHSFGMRKWADEHTTNCVANVKTNVNKASGQRLSVARNITLKEVPKSSRKTVNSTIRVKTENYTRTIFESRIKRKIAVFDTLFIQKIKEWRKQIE